MKSTVNFKCALLLRECTETVMTHLYYTRNINRDSQSSSTTFWNHEWRLFKLLLNLVSFKVYQIRTVFDSYIVMSNAFPRNTWRLLTNLHVFSRFSLRNTYFNDACWLVFIKNTQMYNVKLEATPVAKYYILYAKYS